MAQTVHKNRLTAAGLKMQWHLVWQNASPALLLSNGWVTSL